MELLEFEVAVSVFRQRNVLYDRLLRALGWIDEDEFRKMRLHEFDLQILVAVRLAQLVHERFRVMSQASTTARLNDAMRPRLRGQGAGLAQQRHYSPEKAETHHVDHTL